MAENDHVLQCPVCQGHGELKRSEILKLLSDADFKKHLDVYLAELRHPTEDCEEDTAHLVSVESKSREFGTEVHRWNPQLPIWQRSPKE
jgi:hypothetical protein